MGLFDKLLRREQAAKPPLRRPLPGAGLGPIRPRPEPTPRNHYILSTLDSCRYDSFMIAGPTVIPKITGGEVERRPGSGLVGIGLSVSGTLILSPKRYRNHHEGLREI
jgi:hypothetical protein